MQTFLPVPDFAETARILDYKRLGKQRVEAYQILEALGGVETRWKYHPAVNMWRGSEFRLIDYGLAICREWIGRGYEDNMLNRLLDFEQDALTNRIFIPGRNDHAPWWIGADIFHRTHRSNLLHKDPEHYRKFWPDEPDNLDYLWPPGYPLEEMENA